MNGFDALWSGYVALGLYAARMWWHLGRKLHAGECIGAARRDAANIRDREIRSRAYALCNAQRDALERL